LVLVFLPDELKLTPYGPHVMSKSEIILRSVVVQRKCCVFSVYGANRFARGLVLRLSITGLIPFASHLAYIVDHLQFIHCPSLIDPFGSLTIFSRLFLECRL